MSYEPKPGVLTEEDKARLVLGNTGHDVDVAEILDVVFVAGNEKPEPEEPKEGETETALPKTADLTDSQQDAIESQNSTMEQMTSMPEAGGPSSHIDGNPLEGDKDKGDTESAHAPETNLASDESADNEGSDEPLANPVENKTAEPDAGKATPGLGNDEPAEDAPSTESTPFSADEPDSGTDSTEADEGADSTTTDSGLV